MCNERRTTFKYARLDNFFYLPLVLIRLAADILSPQLMHMAPEFVVACQTFEGGLGGEPGNEAHGGYAFCGLAAMIIMKQPQMLNLQNLAVRSGLLESEE